MVQVYIASRNDREYLDDGLAYLKQNSIEHYLKIISVHLNNEIYFLRE